ncbi:MAG: hypothetical protein LQ345_002260 [Seirophora villosa]|nr:MAG: hypothetical protein LQ345_002260 [Seirophora villosa]
MPQFGGPSKTRSRDGRHSRSRNTTPVSNISIAINANAASHTSYLGTDIGSLMVPTNVTYDHLLNQHGGGQGIPDPASLNQMVDNLKLLAQLAEERSRVCNAGTGELSKRRKGRVEDEHRLDQENRDREEKASFKRAAEEEDVRGRKSLKTKKVKKERSTVREERPLAVGAHGLARQDGRETTPQAFGENVKASPSPPKRKLDAVSSSSLSSTSQPPSPTTGTLLDDSKSHAKSRESSEGSVDPHQPPPAASIAQYQTFGPDPTAFDDPTIYHIRDVTDDMTDEEKAEIFSVKQFPHSDLSHHIPGTIPDKDFSSAKPSNQVNANTFQAYIENFVRLLTEEDMAFLKERGDRVGPFAEPRRGKRHYTEIWAEEDGQFSLDNQHDKDKLPPNEPRGNIEQMTDEIAETDQISNGPMLNRLLALMRSENRPPPSSDDARPNGTSTTSDAPTTNGLANGDINGNTDHPHGETSSSQPNSTILPPATYMPELALPTSWRSSSTANNTTAQQLPQSSLKMDAATIEDRVRQELRYLGLLPSSADNPSNSIEPDYDAHYDDEVAERLRTLQAELRRVSLENGARKARVLQLAEEQMAHQEYSTILEDLDGQVQQAYLKRTRTLGKSKKQVKRPGGAGGGSHPVVNGADGAVGVGVSKPGIGDLARQLMERRKKWVEKIGGVFDEEEGGVAAKGMGMGKGTIFEESIMEKLMKAERERWEEETD